MGSEKSRKKPKREKRRYEKPSLRTIELLAEEILAVGCKTLSSPGSRPGGATSCTGIVCASIGS